MSKHINHRLTYYVGAKVGTQLLVETLEEISKNNNKNQFSIHDIQLTADIITATIEKQITTTRDGKTVLNILNSKKEK